ncbi:MULTISPECIES: nitronate monooxygenase [unclassified Streptomyces]|uniref:nitronate monooxygenase n=1 Tax=unclassified Streptomyces TaxID=2593676 RepID=UPI0037FB6001
MAALTDLSTLAAHPVVQAPMAGGTSTPALAAAVAEGGGVGFLAAGFKTAEGMREEIARIRGLTSRPFGVNVFMPQRETADPARVEEFAARVAGEAGHYGTSLGDPATGGDAVLEDAYGAKIAALLEDPVPLVSFTFGCPEPAVLRGFADAGTVTVVTVTSVAEARAAEEAGAAAVCVQGSEAGGHQSTHRDDPERDGTETGLLALLPQVRAAVSLPLVAAGGIMRGEQIAAVLAAGADAAQMGTAFLACPESGAHPVHKRALTDPDFTATRLTRAFTGRPARSLVNRYLRDHDRYAPPGYPRIHFLTAPVRAAAVKAGDPGAMALWAGQGHAMARDLPAIDLVRLLAAELDSARSAL